MPQTILSKETNFIRRRTQTENKRQTQKIDRNTNRNTKTDRLKNKQTKKLHKTNKQTEKQTD
jgi:hypothetical protein